MVGIKNEIKIRQKEKIEKQHTLSIMIAETLFLFLTKKQHLDGKREVSDPVGNFVSDIGKTLITLSNLGLEILELVSLLGQVLLDLNSKLDSLINVANNALEVLLAETTGGHSRSTDTDTTGNKSRLVTGNRVLVESNVNSLTDSLNTSTVNALVTERNKNHVRVGTVRNELVGLGLELSLKNLSVLEDKSLVFLELGGLGLLEGNGKSSDGVVVGTTLVTRENGEVDGVFQVVKDLLTGLGVDGANATSEEDHGTTGTTERLVSSGGNNVSVLKGRGDDTSGNETRDVGHVDNKVSANLVGNFTHALVVDQAAVGRGTGNKNLGSVKSGGLLEHIVVDDTSLGINAVGHGLKVGGDSRNLSGVSLVTVRKMATVGQVKTHETLMGLHDGLVDLEVGRRAREGLNVDTPLVSSDVESIKSTLLTESFNTINVLVTTVVTSTGVTLRVLVAHGGSQGIKNRLGSQILRSNENNGFTLTGDFVIDDLLDLRVEISETVLNELIKKNRLVESLEVMNMVKIHTALCFWESA